MNAGFGFPEFSWERDLKLTYMYSEYLFYNERMAGTDFCSQLVANWKSQDPIVLIAVNVAYMGSSLDWGWLFNHFGFFSPLDLKDWVAC